jgi:hypothetical protein
MQFPTSRERWAKHKSTEHVYAVGPNNQRAELLETPPSPKEVAKREAAKRAKDAAVARAIAGQSENVSENYDSLNDHLLELASGAIVAGEHGPQLIEFEKPEVPEIEKLQREYDRAKAQENSAAMARLSGRIEAVKEADRVEARDLDQARVMNDPDLYDREALENDLAIGGWEVTDADGQVYSFDTEAEAESFAESLDSSDYAEEDDDEEEEIDYGRSTIEDE